MSRALLLDRLRRGLSATQVEELPGDKIRCLPATPAQVSEVLTSASLGEVRVSLRPQETSAGIHLDLGKLQGLLSVDESSQICEVQAGLPLYALEAALRQRQLTLGPMPYASYFRTVGAVLSAPLPSEASPALGRLRDRASRVYGVVPGVFDQREFPMPRVLAPRRATGPDLKQVLIGGRGRLGVITSASLVLAKMPATVRVAGWLFGSVAAAMDVLLRIFRRHGGVGPADLALLDRTLLLRLAKGTVLPPGEAAVLIRCDGVPSLVETEMLSATGLCAGGGAEELPTDLCKDWFMPPLPMVDDQYAILAPRAERVLPMGSATELAAAFTSDSVSGEAGRVLCGVYLHGAALCAAAFADSTSQPETDLYDALRRELEPRSVLC